MAGKRVAIIDGVRTPFARAFGAYRRLGAPDLGRMAVNELLNRTEIDPEEVDAMIMGCTIAPIAGPNVAREIQFRTGLPRSAPAYTVQMYCASGARAIVDGVHEILAGDTDVVVAGGVDSVSQMRAFFSEELTDALNSASRAKTLHAPVVTPARPSTLGRSLPAPPTRSSPRETPISLWSVPRTTALERCSGLSFLSI